MVKGVCQETLTGSSPETLTRTLKFSAKPPPYMGKINTAVLLLFILAAACFAVLPADAVSARPLVVPDSYSSIAQAVADAADGDTVYVKNGTYAEYSLSIDKAISLVGENAQTTVINLDSPRHEEEMNIIFTHIWHDPALTVDCDNFVLSGFTLTSTGGGIFIEGNRTRITGNSVAVDIQIVGDNLQITNNSFHPQESLNGVYIAGNLCNVAKNQVVGAIYVGGKNNLVTSNDVAGTIGISANSSMIQNNKLHDSSGYITIRQHSLKKHNRETCSRAKGNRFRQHFSAQRGNPMWDGCCPRRRQRLLRQLFL